MTVGRLILINALTRLVGLATPKQQISALTFAQSNGEALDLKHSKRHRAVLQVGASSH